PRRVPRLARPPRQVASADQVTRRDRQKIAHALRQITKNELRDGFNTTTRRDRMIRLATQAQQMGLEPDVLLTVEGRDAFIAIARALRTQRAPKRVTTGTLRAEWTLIIERFFHVTDTATATS